VSLKLELFCPTALEEALIDSIAKGKRPVPIIAVHLYGVPYNVVGADQKNSSEKYGILKLFRR
jgi:hypothetical protein